MSSVEKKTLLMDFKFLKELFTNCVIFFRSKLNQKHPTAALQALENFQYYVQHQRTQHFQRNSTICFCSLLSKFVQDRLSLTWRNQFQKWTFHKLSQFLRSHYSISDQLNQLCFGFHLLLLTFLSEFLFCCSHGSNFLLLPKT